MPALAAALCLAACGRADGPVAHAERWPAADRLFQSDPRWVGGDAAYTIDLGGDRTLWLFADSFIAERPYDRDDIAFVRNSAAIQVGRDPSTAGITFYWGEDADRAPHSFAPDRPPMWLWPMHGAVHDGRLLLFYEVVRTPRDDPHGYESRDWTAFLVRNPGEPPDAWTLEPLDRPATGARLVGGAVLVEPPWLLAYASEDTHHAVRLARFPLDAAFEGDLSGLEWWCGDRWGHCRAEVLLDINAPELSVSKDPHHDRYLMAMSSGYGASTLALRSAPRPEGPWSDPRDVLRPPESFQHDVFVYAGKGHPMLAGADLVMTYVYGDLYFPQFVKVEIP